MLKYTNLSSEFLNILQVQGADFSPDGELLALTTVTGKWLLLDARTREIRTVSQEGCDPLLGVKVNIILSPLRLPNRIVSTGLGPVLSHI